MDMKRWLADVIASEKKKALPLLSFPSAQLMGITVRELIADRDAQVRGIVSVAERCPMAAAVSMMDLSVEAECFGAQIQVSDEEVPTVTGILVHDCEEAERLTVPSAKSGRAAICVQAIREVKERITDRPVFAGVIGPFSLAGRLMDMTEIMVNCYEEPEFVHTTLEKATKFLLEYVKAFKDAGVDGVVMAEPAAGLLSPGLCEEFSVPYVKRIVEQWQDDEFIVIYHNCGPAVKHMVPQLLQTGAAAYHFGNAVSIKEMLELMPEDVLVLGNVDPVSVLRDGDPELVYRETLRILEECEGYKNFLISSGCDIPKACPWENLDAFFKAVDEYYGC